MRTVIIEIPDEEYLHFISIIAGALCSSPDLSPLSKSVLKRVAVVLTDNATPDELVFIGKIESAIRAVMREPSIERGMFMGGVEGLTDRAIDHLEKEGL
jgi:hypothetical protein